MALTIEFRSLEERDFEGILAMAQSAWKFAYESIFDPTFMEAEVNRHYGPSRLAELMPGIRCGRTFFDVALEDGKVLGLCCAGTVHNGVELHRLYLDPAVLGRGLATELLTRLERFVRANGARVCYCYVHKDNERGKLFYLKHGFMHLAGKDTAEDWRMAKVVRTGILGFAIRMKLRIHFQ